MTATVRPVFVGFTSYEAQSDPILTVNPGSNAAGGVGGAGGEKLNPPAVDGSGDWFSSTSTQKLVSTATAGAAGAKRFPREGCRWCGELFVPVGSDSGGTDNRPSNAGELFNGFSRWFLEAVAPVMAAAVPALR